MRGRGQQRGKRRRAAVVQMIYRGSHGVLRKGAHFLEFAVLGILLTGTFHGARNFTLAKPDAVRRAHGHDRRDHQAFTPGRNCALSDVCGSMPPER